MNSTASNTTREQLPDPNYRSHVTIIAQFTSLLVLGVIIALGNLACIITFIKTQSLRKRSQCLLISLSVADFLVSGVVFMSSKYFLTASYWDKRDAFTMSLDNYDLFTGTSSILNLAFISVERFMAIVFPLHHRLLRCRTYLILASLPWVIAAIQTLIDSINRFVFTSGFQLYRYINVAIPGLALLVIIFSYAAIGITIRRSKSIPDNQNRALRDKKLTVTLLIVTLASLVTWLPLQCTTAFIFFCHSCFSVRVNVVFILKFLQYCNSGINVFIYFLRIPEFRKKIMEGICRAKSPLTSNQDSPAATMELSIFNKGLNVDTKTAKSKIQGEFHHLL